MRLWIRDPLAILADDAGSGLVVEDGRIAALVPAGTKPEHYDSIFDAGRHVILPGLVNTHHHFYQTLTRAHPDAINKELFPWLKALYPVWAKLTPEAFRLATRAALVELMLSGCTTSSDHQYVFPKGLEDALDIQAEEALSLGMRMTLNRGAMNLSQKDGGLPPDSVVQDHDTILADCERVAGKYHDASEGAMLQVAIAPCSPFSVTRELMRDSAALAAKCGCRLHTHLAETRDEDAFCLETFGCRPVDYLEEAGWLNDRSWLAHGVHFDDGEIERLGKAGVGVSHCPASNMILASGQCRTLDLEEAGVSLGLGVDGSASNCNSNMIDGVRQALLLNRLRYGASAVTHLDVLRWASEGSARCLGRSDIGTIAAGKQADLALFTLEDMRFSGAADPIAALVLCGAQKADRVMIAGKWTIEDGAPVGIDIARLRHEHGEIAKLFA